MIYFKLRRCYMYNNQLDSLFIFYYYILWLCSPARAMAFSSHEVSWSHTATRHSWQDSSWTSDQLVAETSTWQNTTHKTEKHLYPRWDSNPRSQQASGHWDRHSLSLVYWIITPLYVSGVSAAHHQEVEWIYVQIVRIILLSCLSTGPGLLTVNSEV
jgi:hypothetical protein